MRVNVTRDSVAAGDDVYAPHAHAVTVADDASLLDLARAIFEPQNYLARISGGTASWHIAHDGAAVVFGEQDGHPFLLEVGEAASVSGALTAVHVHYDQQTLPKQVAERLGMQRRPRSFWPFK